MTLTLPAVPPTITAFPSPLNRTGTRALFCWFIGQVTEWLSMQSAME